MTKKKMIVSLCLLAAAAGLVLVVRGADACSDCDSPSTAAQDHDEASPEGSHCSLAPNDRQHAAKELRAFNRQYLGQVKTEITASYSGDRRLLDKTLSAIIEREASCCSHLDISKVETETGYDVTVRGERMAITELQSILAASVP